MPQPIDRAAIAADLERARIDFQHLIEMADDDDWIKSTKGTRWNNEELLFHMVFGYMLVQRLLLLMRLFDRLPDSVSRGYARMLNRVTPPFDVIYYYGSRFAARIYNRKRMAAKLDHIINSLQRSLRRAPEDAFRRGMHYPNDWDPYFRDYMTLEDVYRYPGQHYVGLTPDGGHLTGGTAGPAGRMSVCRASVGSTPRSFGSRLPAW